MNNILMIIYPKKYLDTLDKKIKKLDNKRINLNNYLMVRIIVEIILFIGLLLIPIYGLYLSVLLTILFHYLYEDILITSPLIKKDKQMYEDIYYFLKVYSLSLNSNYSTYEAFLYTASAVDNFFTREIKNLKKEKLDFHHLLKKLSIYLPQDLDILDNIDELSKNELMENLKKVLNELENTDKIKMQNYINNVPLKVILISIIFLSIVIFIILEGPKYLG